MANTHQMACAGITQIPQSPRLVRDDICLQRELLMQPDFADDFADVVDGLETVTLRRRESNTVVAVTAARRLAAVSREAEVSAGAVVRSDVEWHLVLGDDTAPQVGDIVIDAQGNHWTILVAEQLPHLQRWKCAARELRIVYGCGERVDIERPVWSEGESPEIVGWTYVVTALPVRIQPVEVGVGDDGSGEAVFHIIMGESIAVEPHDRFVAGDGTVYALHSFEQAERIDALPIARVVRE
jgi:hypothetical protein